MSEVNGFESWAILELMGHVRVAGFVTEQEVFGAKLGRIEIPTERGPVTQFFGGSSVYRLTPCDEATARAVALHNEPEPVHHWELPEPQAPKRLACARCGHLVIPGQSCWNCREDDSDADDPELS